MYKLIAQYLQMSPRYNRSVCLSVSTCNMADESLVLDEFSRFLTELPKLHEDLRSNLSTDILQVADHMLKVAEEARFGGTLFIFLFESWRRRDHISIQIEELLQDIVGEYEGFVQRYTERVQRIQDQATDHRFRCQHEPVTGGERSRGRPRFLVSRQQIEGLRELGFSWTKISTLIGVSRVTLYRRRQQLGIATENNYSEMSNLELDAIIKSIVDVSPNSGEVMMRGAVLGRGLIVQRRRIRDSIVRVDPVGAERRQRMRIQRRRYAVPGPNSLWHIDGNHKLIRWRIVIHGGIDGYSRVIVFLKCNTNNEADTVMNLFAHAVEQFHIPYRVRSDHGTENIEVARWMINQGVTTANPFITGRSVHNQRIERLWRDVGESFVLLYQSLFYFMEDQQVLDPLSEIHLYALHFVYLPRINRSIEEFVLEWNNHPVSTEHFRTPFQIWTEGFYYHAHSRQEPVRIALEQTQINPIAYGIDDYGPLPELQTRNHVAIPRSQIQLTDQQRIALLLCINPLDDDGNHGIDIYTRTVQIITEIVQHTAQ